MGEGVLSFSSSRSSSLSRSCDLDTSSSCTFCRMRRRTIIIRELVITISIARWAWFISLPVAASPPYRSLRGSCLNYATISRSATQIIPDFTFCASSSARSASASCACCCSRSWMATRSTLSESSSPSSRSSSPCGRRYEPLQPCL
jgi:hypothetical protein